MVIVFLSLAKCLAENVRGKPEENPPRSGHVDFWEIFSPETVRNRTAHSFITFVVQIAKHTEMMKQGIRDNVY